MTDLPPSGGSLFPLATATSSLQASGGRAPNQEGTAVPPDWTRLQSFDPGLLPAAAVAEGAHVRPPSVHDTSSDSESSEDGRRRRSKHQQRSSSHKHYSKSHKHKKHKHGHKEEHKPSKRKRYHGHRPPLRHAKPRVGNPPAAQRARRRPVSDFEARSDAGRWLWDRPLTDAEKIEIIEARAAARDADQSSRRAWKGWKVPSASDQATATEYYFDSKADPDNLAYGCLYRTDVASYFIDDTDWYEQGDGICDQIRARYRGRSLATEQDGHKQPKKSSGRYFSSKAVLKERSRKLRRVHVGEQRKIQETVQGQGSLATPLLGDEVQILSTLTDPTSTERSTKEVHTQGETVDEYILRRTKEFNVVTREQPHAMNVWMQFAAFQDEIMQLLQKRTDEKQVVEKKIAIYERALGYHQGSDTLLLAMLEEARKVEPPDEIERQWRRVLNRNGGSARLWRSYIVYRTAQFSTFSVSSLRRIYAEAQQALSLERVRREQNNAPTEIVEEILHYQLEFVIDLCQLELQSGHTEMMVGRMQAFLEYACFAPEATLGMHEASKTRLFRKFWDSQVPRIGENGSRGWLDYYAQGGRSLEPEDGSQADPSVPEGRNLSYEPETEDPGGWSGWQFKHLSESAAQPGSEEESEQFQNPFNIVKETEMSEGTKASGEDPVDEDDEEDTAELTEALLDDFPAEEDEATLMARLGLKLDEGLKGLGDEITATVVEQWLNTEQEREATQWMPLREDDNEAGGDIASSLQRIVDFDDVQESLVTLPSHHLKVSAINRCLSLLRCPSGCIASPPWSSNDLFELQRMSGVVESVVSSPVDQLFNQQPEPPAWLTPSTGAQEVLWVRGTGSRHRFIQNVLSLVSSTFPAQSTFADALISHSMRCPEESDAAKPSPKSACVNLLNRCVHLTRSLNPLPVCMLASDHSRASSKSILAVHQHDLPMWAAYAWAESAQGRISTARRIMDTVLSALPTLPANKFRKAPQAFLAYAEIELQSNMSDSFDRAIHILCSLPEGGAFCPLPSNKGGKKLSTAAATAATSDRIQRCQAGYKSLLETVLTGMIEDDTGIAVVTCTALFTFLTRGLDAASAIYTQVIGRVPKEVQKMSSLYEILHLRHIALVQAAITWKRQRKQSFAAVHGNVAGGLLGSWQPHEEHMGPSHVLALLSEALALYPTSPRLLMQLMAVELECSALARLRRTLDSTMKKHPGPVVWMQALRVEACTTSSSAAPRIRSLLERALSNASGQPSVLLWRVYIAFELASGRPDAARRVFFRAINACPWSKAVWLDGFKELCGHISPSEVGELLDVMREKDLFLRTDMYEILLNAV